MLYEFYFINSRKTEVARPIPGGFLLESGAYYSYETVNTMEVEISLPRLPPLEDVIEHPNKWELTDGDADLLDEEVLSCCREMGFNPTEKEKAEILADNYKIYQIDDWRFINQNLPRFQGDDEDDDDA